MNDEGGATVPPEATPGRAECQEEMDRLEKAVEEARKELDRQTLMAKEYLEAAKRIQADFDNHKKRIQREWEEYVKLANEKLVLDLLPTIDDFERALEADCSPEELRTGLRSIHDNLLSLLKSYGLREIPSNGMFDPEYHEVLSTGEGEDGEILEVYQKGYFLGPKVLRHSKVKVAKKRGDDDV